MLEIIFCSIFTILPDYLYRRYAQGKRLGKELTIFSVWYELRWGITGCLMLTISLIIGRPPTREANVLAMPIISRSRLRSARPNAR